MLIAAFGPEIPYPAYGVGTALFKKDKNSGLNPQVIESVKTAVEAGFRHLDCAQVYGNEEEVGMALKEIDIPREKLFITSKVFDDIGDIHEALGVSLRNIGVDYLDLFLLHTPLPFYEKNVSFEKAWSELESELGQGRVHAIGVSNFRIKDLEPLLHIAAVKPRVNQIEFHPQVFKAAKPILDFCKKNNIIVEGYGPLSPIVRDSEGPTAQKVRELAKKYGVSDTEILLNWCKSFGVLPITTSSKRERMATCLKFEKFKLEQADIDALTELGVAHHKRIFMQHMDED
ncbi:NADH/NADPH dependent indole-3-acetaldehyde reductase AKR3C2 [Schizosaccharomyces japonicus yFS275]|uniref:NADH/NADPH dependent indole-3-acetaldehyde reductase AKR3C2 n=1 Tax=Schizosaccharomyces japonicus (strain yFS275 / FY16936) TaxID=402676 RepID=B6JZ45_SCHJY|nr:NADH/NADPH dependent indole-3-acetaldehyde reductase AKR3C2 [Schizosaccharomyces japonicus yFS275]EEB06813.1 NADH/NADPH dependent indole-3-acetaldehyde reductase AKR3C2 [Schizosaccharomyces japonicus yFS275]